MLETTTTKASEAEQSRDINEVLDEARAILAGKSILLPTREHLQALHDAAEFWRYIAVDPGKDLTAPTPIVGYRTQCERCGRGRASHSTIVRRHLYLCECCAQKHPDYAIGVVQ